MRPALEHWLNHNSSDRRGDRRRASSWRPARARRAARRRPKSSRKSADIGPPQPARQAQRLHQLADRDDSELFVVEGDSAGGSAKQGRDRARQAILPLRGKVMNTEGMSLAKVLENKELADLVTALGCGLGKSFDLSRLRYGKVIILADADSDGHHIATLLLTFIYRHLPQLDHQPARSSSRSRRSTASTSARRRSGRSTMRRRDRLLKQHGNGRGTPEITRFKGLGEMMPKVLWETTLNPRTRRLLRVEIADQIVTDRVINELMGKDASARFRFIMERAEEAQELDL